MSHWAAQYIGLPWISGDNDCWSFSRKVWKDHFSINVPVVDVDANSLLACTKAFSDKSKYSNWLEVIKPIEGDAVLMSIGKHPSHVGIWCLNKVLHCAQGCGVILTDRVSLNLMGFKILGFYRHITLEKDSA